jgi:hypothetical protein
MMQNSKVTALQNYSCTVFYLQIARKDSVLLVV